MLVALTGAVAFYFAKVTAKGTSQLAALMIGMWPSYVFNSAMVRRDNIYIFLFLSAYLVISIFSRKKNTTIGEIFLFIV